MKDPNAIKGKKVFLVEDDAFLTKIIKQKISDAGCDFFNSLNGESSIAVIEKEMPDVIILDLLLPGGIDGFGVLQKIKEHPALKTIPVIILSNLSKPSEIERGIELGAFRYILKSSIEPDEILDHVESALLSIVR